MVFRETEVTRRRAEEEDLLTSRGDDRGQEGEYLSQPRPTGEHVVIGRHVFTGGETDSLRAIGRDRTDGGLRLPVFAALLEKRIEHGLASATRGEETGVWLEDTPGHVFEIHLGPALGAIGAGESLVAYAGSVE